MCLVSASCSLSSRRVLGRTSMNQISIPCAGPRSDWTVTIVKYMANQNISLVVSITVYIKIIQYEIIGTRTQKLFPDLES